MGSIILVLLGVWLALTFDLTAFLGGLAFLAVFVPLLAVYMYWDEKRGKEPNNRL